MLLHADLVRHFYGERSLPNGVVEGITIEHWGTFLEALKKQPWSVRVDGADFRQLTAHSVVPASPDSPLVTVKVKPSDDVQFNVFPYEPGAIDFDFDTAEMRGQPEVDQLSDFVTMLGRCVERDVILSHEGSDSHEFVVYSPATDEFRFTDGSVKVGGFLACVCCDYRTIGEAWDICPICFWEHDGSSVKNLEQVSGANHMSLDDGRRNFAALGACDQRFVDKVLPPERRADFERLDRARSLKPSG